MREVTVLANGNVLVSIPITLRESSGKKRIITEEKNTMQPMIPLWLTLPEDFIGKRWLTVARLPMCVSWQGL